MQHDQQSFSGHPYSAFLHRVAKPARYTGGEVGSVERAWTDEVAKVCLAFPDVYDIGMSHLGFRILYKILNDDPRTLAERCYTPWIDLEGELRARGLPLVSLESRRPLSDFDVVGFSLQFELTYSNILTMLDLGGIPLRAAERGDDDPLVLAGGPTATHPEPIAPFIDAFVIGDGERKATEVALTWVDLKKRGVPRRERLVALAKLGAVYVPSLYATRIDGDTGFEVVEGPLEPGVPPVVSRSLVDLKDFPFPDRGPTGGPEAVFDRMSIEIARGCTEGCRFCQAGMIYRPVRERDPEEIVDTVVRAVKSSGQDEVSLTALSTADVSCIAPLIKRVTERLAGERISLGVSSLRAYGLAPDLLDELKRVRATGLTFAPEAGTQRMRDVVNKNVTEEQLLETAERVFSRGWGRMKLYFMIGLPTETDDDVRGVVETGARALAAGKRAVRKGAPAEVTVSVSTHVPKPHTPFQWCAMDALEEVGRKQGLLKESAKHHRGLRLRTHGADASVLEGVFARGDRRLADVLERAWRAGARFDSWEDQLRLDLWREALAHYGVEPRAMLGSLPVDARLPWDHIDVGLEEGFLAREYRKAMRSRLSPPCGKVAGTFVHHDNATDARADERRLVCYDCGVACDLTSMREQRVDYLERLGAERRLPLYVPDEAQASLDRPGAGTALGGVRHRFRFEKIGPMALLGHLDLVRELPRVLRRAGVAMEYKRGFHPKPDLTFAPALPLGVLSLDEYVDVRLAERWSDEALSELVVRLTSLSPMGLRFTDATALGPTDPSISKVLSGARYLLVVARRAVGGDADAEKVLAQRCARVMESDELTLIREVRGGRGLGKKIDVKRYLRRAVVADQAALSAVARAGLVGDLCAIEVEVALSQEGGVKTSELAQVLLGAGPDADPGGAEVPPHHAVRVELLCGALEEGAAVTPDGALGAPRTTRRSTTDADALDTSAAPS